MRSTEGGLKSRSELANALARIHGAPAEGPTLRTVTRCGIKREAELAAICASRQPKTSKRVDALLQRDRYAEAVAVQQRRLPHSHTAIRSLDGAA